MPIEKGRTRKMSNKTKNEWNDICKEYCLDELIVK